MDRQQILIVFLVLFIVGLMVLDVGQRRENVGQILVRERSRNLKVEDFGESLKKMQEQLESHLAVTTVGPVTSSEEKTEQTTKTRNTCISNLNQGHWRSPTLNHKKCAEAHEKSGRGSRR